MQNIAEDTITASIGEFPIPAKMYMGRLNNVFVPFGKPEQVMEDFAAYCRANEQYTDPVGNVPIREEVNIFDDLVLATNGDFANSKYGFVSRKTGFESLVTVVPPSFNTLMARYFQALTVEEASQVSDNAFTSYNKKLNDRKLVCQAAALDHRLCIDGLLLSNDDFDKESTHGIGIQVNCNLTNFETMANDKTHKNETVDAYEPAMDALLQNDVMVAARQVIQIMSTIGCMREEYTQSTNKWTNESKEIRNFVIPIYNDGEKTAIVCSNSSKTCAKNTMYDEDDHAAKGLATTSRAATRTVGKIPDARAFIVRVELDVAKLIGDEWAANNSSLLDVDTSGSIEGAFIQTAYTQVCGKAAKINNLNEAVLKAIDQNAIICADYLFVVQRNTQCNSPFLFDIKGKYLKTSANGLFSTLVKCTESKTVNTSILHNKVKVCSNLVSTHRLRHMFGFRSKTESASPNPPTTPYEADVLQKIRPALAQSGTTKSIVKGGQTYVRRAGLAGRTNPPQRQVFVPGDEATNTLDSFVDDGASAAIGPVYNDSKCMTNDRIWNHQKEEWSQCVSITIQLGVNQSAKFVNLNISTQCVFGNVPVHNESKLEAIDKKSIFESFVTAMVLILSRITIKKDGFVADEMGGRESVTFYNVIKGITPSGNETPKLLERAYVKLKTSPFCSDISKVCPLPAHIRHFFMNRMEMSEMYEFFSMFTASTTDLASAFYGDENVDKNLSISPSQTDQNVLELAKGFANDSPDTKCVTAAECKPTPVTANEVDLDSAKRALNANMKKYKQVFIYTMISIVLGMFSKDIKAVQETLEERDLVFTPSVWEKIYDMVQKAAPACAGVFNNYVTQDIFTHFDYNCLSPISCTLRTNCASLVMDSSKLPAMIDHIRLVLLRLAFSPTVVDGKDSKFRALLTSLVTAQTTRLEELRRKKIQEQYKDNEDIGDCLTPFKKRKPTEDAVSGGLRPAKKILSVDSSGALSRDGSGIRIDFPIINKVIEATRLFILTKLGIKDVFAKLGVFSDLANVPITEQLKKHMEECKKAGNCTLGTGSIKFGKLMDAGELKTHIPDARAQNMFKFVHEALTTLTKDKLDLFEASATHDANVNSLMMAIFDGIKKTVDETCNTTLGTVTPVPTKVSDFVDLFEKDATLFNNKVVLHALGFVGRGLVHAYVEQIVTQMEDIQKTCTSLVLDTTGSGANAISTVDKEDVFRDRGWFRSNVDTNAALNSKIVQATSAIQAIIAMNLPAGTHSLPLVSGGWLGYGRSASTSQFFTFSSAMWNIAAKVHNAEFLQETFTKIHNMDDDVAKLDNVTAKILNEADRKAAIVNAHPRETIYLFFDDNIKLERAILDTLGSVFDNNMRVQFSATYAGGLTPTIVFEPVEGTMRKDANGLYGRNSFSMTFTVTKAVDKTILGTFTDSPSYTLPTTANGVHPLLKA